MAVEAVKLHDVTGAALFVGDFVQSEIDALMLLVAGGAVETVRDLVIGWEGDALRASRLRYGRSRGEFAQPFGASLQRLRRSTVRVEGRVRHLVAGKASLAVGEGIAGDETTNPAQFSGPAAAMTIAAIL